MDVTDILMEVQNFISALTECTGDRHYKCITRSEISFETLTNNSTSRAAFSQLKTEKENNNDDGSVTTSCRYIPGLFQYLILLSGDK